MQPGVQMALLLGLAAGGATAPGPLPRALGPRAPMVAPLSSLMPLPTPAWPWVGAVALGCSLTAPWWPLASMPGRSAWRRLARGPLWLPSLCPPAPSAPPQVPQCAGARTTAPCPLAALWQLPRATRTTVACWWMALCGAGAGAALPTPQTSTGWWPLTMTPLQGPAVY